MSRMDEVTPCPGYHLHLQTHLLANDELQRDKLLLTHIRDLTEYCFTRQPSGNRSRDALTISRQADVGLCGGSGTKAGRTCSSALQWAGFYGWRFYVIGALAAFAVQLVTHGEYR
jgi:hypothetical protein